MKVRTGFVSNSSSSSFVITGKGYELRDFKDLLFKSLTESQIQKYEEDPYWFLDGGCEDGFSTLFPDIDVIYDGEGDCVYLGEIPTASKKQKERISKLIEKFDVSVKPNQVTLINEELYC